MSLNKDWCTFAMTDVTWLHDLRRPLRVATDCSGLTTPEIALTEAVGCKGSKVVTVFCSDTYAASRTIASAIHTPQHIFPDMLDRTYGADFIKSTDQHGEEVVIRRSDAALDFYIAGTMCTPFSAKGVGSQMLACFD